MIIDKIDKSTFHYFKDEPNDKGSLGITHNRIVEIPNFVTPDAASKMTQYFEAKAEMWGDIAFTGHLVWG